MPLSVLLTASHNPWKDGGYNFLTGQGCVADNKIVEKIADNIEKVSNHIGVTAQTGRKGRIIDIEPYEIYKKYFSERRFVDFEAIKKADIAIFYEDFGGTGRYYFPKLMSDNGLTIKEVLSSKTVGPNPSKENLQNLAVRVKNSNSKLKIGLATDGDSDRFGIIDEAGNYISASDAILLCAYHLIKNKGIRQGTIIRNNSTSAVVDMLANYFNKKGCAIEVEQTPVGFKYLGGKMLELEKSNKPAIVVGEESGGLTIRNHLPEKDGFVAMSIILDLMAKENKPISKILQEIQRKIGVKFYSKSINISFVSDNLKEKTLTSFIHYLSDKTAPDRFAGIPIDKVKTTFEDQAIRKYKPDGDGIKIYLKDNSSVLIRKSGTEPVLRMYIDAASESSFNKLKAFLVKMAQKNGGKQEV